MIKNLFEKPFRLLSIVGSIYITILIILNLTMGYSYERSIYPFAAVVTFTCEGLALILFILSFFFISHHFFYSVGLELLVIANLYDGVIYSALLLSSVILVLMLVDVKRIKKRTIISYGVIEVVKLGLVIPYGVSDFINYVGLTLFALGTIGCINLLFRHAYSNNTSSELKLEDLKLTDRQKVCIKEIVLNNTTIKALAIDFNVSESAIKKDLATIYKVLGITGKADLKALFIGYDFA